MCSESFLSSIDYPLYIKNAVTAKQQASTAASGVITYFSFLLGDIIFMTVFTAKKPAKPIGRCSCSTGLSSPLPGSDTTSLLLLHAVSNSRSQIHRRLHVVWRKLRPLWPTTASVRVRLCYERLSNCRKRQRIGTPITSHTSDWRKQYRKATPRKHCD